MNENPEQALDVVVNAKKDNVQLEHFAFNTLTTLKTQLEAKNINVPFEIPQQVT